MCDRDAAGPQPVRETAGAGEHHIGQTVRTWPGFSVEACDVIRSVGQVQVAEPR